MAEPLPRDLAVPNTKTAALRYLAECAAHGYVLFQSGEVPREKAIALFEKFDDRYNVIATRGVRDHARSCGRSCARLVMFPKDVEQSIWLFWLMATEGTGELPEAGNVQDARAPQQRLQWGEQYELVSRPVRRRSGNLHHVWTWVFSDEAYAGWKERLNKAAGRVRSSSERKVDFLVQQVDFIRRVPGFQGINRQKRQLILAANIPREIHELLKLGALGNVVDKSLPVFVAGRTLRAMVEASSPSDA